MELVGLDLPETASRPVWDANTPVSRERSALNCGYRKSKLHLAISAKKHLHAWSQSPVFEAALKTNNFTGRRRDDPRRFFKRRQRPAQHGSSWTLNLSYSRSDLFRFYGWPIGTDDNFDEPCFRDA